MGDLGCGCVCACEGSGVEPELVRGEGADQAGAELLFEAGEEVGLDDVLAGGLDVVASVVGEEGEGVGVFAYVAVEVVDDFLDEVVGVMEVVEEFG